MRGQVDGREGCRGGEVDCSLSNAIERLTAAGEWLRARLCSFGAVGCPGADWRDWQAGAGEAPPVGPAAARGRSRWKQAAYHDAHRLWLCDGLFARACVQPASITLQRDEGDVMPAPCRIRLFLPSFGTLVPVRIRMLLRPFAPAHPIASRVPKSSGHKMHQSGTRRLIARWLPLLQPPPPPSSIYTQYLCSSGRTCHDTTLAAVVSCSPPAAVIYHIAREHGLDGVQQPTATHSDLQHPTRRPCQAPPSSSSSSSSHRTAPWTVARVRCSSDPTMDHGFVNLIRFVEINLPAPTRLSVEPKRPDAMPTRLLGHAYVVVSALQLTRPANCLHLPTNPACAH